MAGLVITYSGISAPYRRFAATIFSMWILNSDFREMGPMGNIPLGCSKPSREP